MPDTHDRIIDELMEQLVEQGPGGMAAVFTRLFNLAMRFERENYLSARHYERTDERRGYANGIKPKRIDTEAGTLVVDVPKTAGTDEPFYPRSLDRCRGTFPNDEAIGRLVDAILLEQVAEGADRRGRYMTLETIASPSDDLTIGLQAMVI